MNPTWLRRCYESVVRVQPTALTTNNHHCTRPPDWYECVSRGHYHYQCCGCPSSCGVSYAYGKPALADAFTRQLGLDLDGKGGGNG